MKRFPVLSILYYGFAVIFGVILTFYWFAYGESSKVAKSLADNSSKNNYYDITRLLSVYQNPSPVLEVKSLADGTTFSVYEVDTTYSKKEDDTTSYYLEKGYMGIINNPGDGWNRETTTDVDGLPLNAFGLRFEGLNSNGDTVTYNYRIGYDASDSSLSKLSDEEVSLIKNRFYSYQTAGFYYFMVGDVVFEEVGFDSITSFSFIQSDESVYETYQLENAWKLESGFFTTVSSINDEYNLAIKNKESSDELNKKAANYLTVVEEAGYSSTNYSDVVKYVQLQNVLKIIGYFLIVLILGDFLVGKHRIIHLFGSIFMKNKKSGEDDLPDYMKTYEVNVVFKAVVPLNYTKPITIKYTSDEGKVLELTLRHTNSYEDSMRIQNGLFRNPEVHADGLKCVDLPSQINVKGFKYSQEFIFENEK